MGVGSRDEVEHGLLEREGKLVGRGLDVLDSRPLRLTDTDPVNLSVGVNARQEKVLALYCDPVGHWPAKKSATLKPPL